jgi:hypothetical protein
MACELSDLAWPIDHLTSSTAPTSLLSPPVVGHVQTNRDGSLRDSLSGRALMAREALVVAQLDRSSK